MQVAMFSHWRHAHVLAQTIKSFAPDVIYIDGIRLVDQLAHIGRLSEGRPIIVDFDDLMSRRATVLHRASLPLSAGYLTKSVPAPVMKLINARVLRNAILRYEAFCLARQEREAVEAAHAVTLVSRTDAAALSRTLDARARNKVHVIAPPVSTVRRLMRPVYPLRFVFIGSDRQLQNRLSIEYLCDVWRRVTPDVELVIYGRMVRRYQAVPNVRFAGFAPSQADVYTKNSVALCPAFLAGGIKSKVMEAIAHGCVPVGNETAFEGLGFHEPALAMHADDFERFVANPWPHMDAALRAAERFAAWCESEHSVTAFTTRWRNLLRLSPALPEQPSAMSMPAHQPLQL
ncbi:glycosyltransferase family 4 protein [Paraburkholderia sp. MMS20-SJTN17]|uniref:Glycosyltransferase family 4 protein n=1 Tax=Paraburkholderia translucens TaxID=2886945 RepID=A0ABS8KFS6_9BURK|nr:glycosyltransferase [Paraburkholderia sp. MMS20-SJTN17]MCC8403289.1 glycosyltransferase family 4 protein [Paraburkholderia sp. MMS20-SJTN17]